MVCFVSGSLLVQRLGVDKSIVMPRIEEFILYQQKYPDFVTGGWDIVGRWVFTGAGTLLAGGSLQELEYCWQVGLYKR